MKKSWTARVVVVPAVVTAVALSGCTPQPSTAATIAGHRITEQNVRDAAHAVGVLQPQLNTEASRPSIVVLLMRGKAAEKIGQDKGIRITDSEREGVLGQAYPPELIADPQAKRIYDGNLDFLILRSRLGAEFTNLVAAQHPVINPRYGTWDPKEFKVDTSTTSLSTPYVGQS